MSLLALAADELLRRFADRAPTPGGGSAAALAGALAGALVEMVASLARTRSGAPEERGRLDAALAAARGAGERLRGLVDEDSRAYQAVVEAYRLPKGSDAEQALRKERVAAALEQATRVPLATAEACLQVLEAAAVAAADGNSNALSDARTAALLAHAGLLAAVENVRINASGAGWGKEVLGRADALVADAEARLAAIRRAG